MRKGLILSLLLLAGCATAPAPVAERAQPQAPDEGISESETCDRCLQHCTVIAPGQIVCESECAPAKCKVLRPIKRKAKSETTPSALLPPVYTDEDPNERVPVPEA